VADGEGVKINIRDMACMHACIDIGVAEPEARLTELTEFRVI